ncbi:hypothetical protein N7451_009418 [Penicillium sp. IBT 35674x]|nr:hypothetical protein N7451_009418 [Penicillium sp. IBT 35674x]
MAFNLVQSHSGAELGPELSDVFTDEVGFKGLSGDANVRLLPTPWPEDSLPSPTSSLLAVAQSKGVVVGAGPDALVIASAESVRKAIEAPAGEDKVKTKPFQPQATIPLPARPTHVAFTANDDALILATENGSQLSVFKTTDIVQGNAQPAISIPTNGASIRALAPNPDPNSTFVALVTANGELLVADLKAGNLVSGTNGPILRNGVSSVAWSNKGKQLVAGLVDGTADQMTPDGTKKDAIPRPSDLEGDCHVSSVSWLENDVFFMVYTPNATDDGTGQNPPSSYYIITRRKQAPFLIQKLPEICSTMGFAMNRSPAYNFTVRLRDYKPALKDVLIVSSTASTDVGLITRSDQPLASDETSKALVGQFTTTEVNDDAKRASVPLKDSVDETSVIGLAADLSCRETVIAPIAGEDISESSTPLPGIMLLNNDGILSYWWFIYSDAIRQKVPYSGLVSAPQTSMTASQVQPPTPAQAPQQPAFGQSSFGTPSAMGSSTFGKPSAGASFGSPSGMGSSTMGATAFGKPSFGSPSQINGGSTPAFGKPSFGTPSQPGVGFGSTSTLGQAQFGKPGFGASSAASSSPFGQPSTPGKSLLGTGSGSTGGGFASKPAEPAFGKPAGQSVFAAAPTPSPFGAKPQTDTAFPPPSNEVKNPFGGGTSGFTLGSSFKPDGTAATDLPKSDNKSSGAFSFGGSIDDMVSSGKTSPQPESMDDVEDATADAAAPPVKAEPSSMFGKPTSQTTSMFGKPTATTSPFGQPKPATESPFGKPTPPTESPFGKPTPAQESPFGKPTPAQTSPFGKPTPANSNPFGKPAATTSPFGKPTTTTPSIFGKPATEPTPKAPSPIETTKSGFSMFGNNTATQNTNQSPAQNQLTSPLSAPSDKTATPKREQSVSTPTFPSSFDTPLPPDATSRDSYAPGDTSASSNVSKSSIEDAPLPPDFTSLKKSAPKVDDAPLPPDFLSQKKSSVKAEEAPLPPDFLTKPKKTEDAPLPPDFLSKPKKAEDKPSVPEDAPLPPDFVTSKPKPAPSEEAVPVPDESDAESDIDSGEDAEEDAEEDGEEDADDSDFSDSGEEITHDETELPSPKPSAQSSFAGFSDKSSSGGLFGGLSKPKQGQAPSTLFGEITKQPHLPPPGRTVQSAREPFRSPSPTRSKPQKSTLFKTRSEKPVGSALHARKASLTQFAQQRGDQLRKASDTAQEEQLRAQQAVKQRQEEEEALSLSEDDEDERLRADLSRPVEPVATLDPFLPHQNYMGETAKPGIPGMIERLYRDINSMVDTLGINSRSMESYLLYQQRSQTSDVEKLVDVLQSEQPANIIDEKLLLQDISKLDEVVSALVRSLSEQRVQGVEEKLTQCRELLTKDIVTLRGQCASIRKTLDAHTDTGAILAAPLSAEHATLQHDLRTTFTDIQSKMADLEQGVSLLRAKIADVPRADSDSRQSKRPTVEAVTKTIATMMSMAENKSSDIDVLEAQMRKLGIDMTNTIPSSREGSPFTTPRKNVGRFPTTPGSRGSIDNSAYHTPESASHGVSFRASINGSARHSRLRSVESFAPVVVQEESARWKVKTQRRQHLVGNLKAAFEKKEIKVRGVDEF